MGRRLERHLWRKGIFLWEDFLEKAHIPGISAHRKCILDRELTRALSALEKGDIEYFAGRLHHTEYWRLFEAFRNDTLCLDIETTGGSAGEGQVTMVGMYGRGQMHTLVKGRNLKTGTLIDTISQYKLIITYHGRAFDIPFLHQSMPGICISMPNYDLCPASHRLGIKGGLKKLEAYFGIRRWEAIEKMNGYDAVPLWNRYMEGDDMALELLTRYNEADTKNLYLLGDILYGMLKNEHGPRHLNTGQDDNFGVPRGI